MKTQKCEFCSVIAPTGPCVTGQEKLPFSQTLDPISSHPPHPLKNRTSREMAREREKGGGPFTFNAHFTAGQPYQNNSIIPPPLELQLIYRAMAPELQIILAFSPPCSLLLPKSRFPPPSFLLPHFPKSLHPTLSPLPHP